MNTTQTSIHSANKHGAHATNQATDQATAPSRQQPKNVFKPRRSRMLAAVASVVVSTTIVASVVSGFGAQADAAMQLAQDRAATVVALRA